MTGSLAFAELVRCAGAAARTLDLEVPGFRSPPATGNRTIRRRPDGSAVVAVRIPGRTALDIALDVVAGIAAANGLAEGHPDITRLRTMVIAGDEELETQARARNVG